MYGYRSQVVYNAKTGEVVDPDFSKDFNSMVGGWPGGEMGVAMFVDTVRSPGLPVAAGSRDPRANRKPNTCERPATARARPVIG